MMFREEGFPRDKYGYCQNNQVSTQGTFKIIYMCLEVLDFFSRGRFLGRKNKPKMFHTVCG